MNKYKFLFFILFLLGTSLAAEPKFPIVFVHGFLGWGIDEMHNYHYWGGKMNLPDSLRAAGFDVIVLSLGPVSSNHDRAVEAFTQLKGGELDYGHAHSKQYGLVQKPGKKYNGLYPKWSAEHPLDFVCHSQGGLSIRKLEMLLQSADSSESSSLLSQKQKGWIRSITTISTPHNGTTLSDIVLESTPNIGDWLKWFAAMQEGSFIERAFDFDMEQWGLRRKDDENIFDYFQRVGDIDMSQNKNTVAYSLSTKGVQAFNAGYRPNPNVWYFSYITSATEADGDGNFKPSKSLNLLLYPSALKMGSDSSVPTNWRENDGVVNCASMIGPFIQGLRIQNANEGLAPGQWNVMGKVQADHQTVIGHTRKDWVETDMLDFYLQICNHLSNLPE